MERSRWPFGVKDCHTLATEAQRWTDEVQPFRQNHWISGIQQFSTRAQLSGHHKSNKGRAGGCGRGQPRSRVQRYESRAGRATISKSIRCQVDLLREGLANGRPLEARTLSMTGHTLGVGMAVQSLVARTKACGSRACRWGKGAWQGRLGHLRFKAGTPLLSSHGGWKSI